MLPEQSIPVRVLIVLIVLDIVLRTPPPWTSPPEPLYVLPDQQSVWPRCTTVCAQRSKTRRRMGRTSASVPEQRCATGVLCAAGCDEGESESRGTNSNDGIAAVWCTTTGRHAAEWRCWKWGCRAGCRTDTGITAAAGEGKDYGGT
jgi:hypothetical protein